MSETPKLTNTASSQHPHEPGIPPALDGDGRCLVCALIVEHEAEVRNLDKKATLWKTRLVAELARLRAELAIERDWLAEQWLTDQHSPEWYIGDATDAEWGAAYAAVDAALDGER